VFIRTRKKAKCLSIFTHNKASPNLFLSSTKSCFLLRPYIFIFTRIISEYRFVSDSRILLFIFHFFMPLYYTTYSDLKIKVTVFFLISKLFRSLYNIYYIFYIHHSLLSRTQPFYHVFSFFQLPGDIYFKVFIGGSIVNHTNVFTPGFILKTLFCTSTTLTHPTVPNVNTTTTNPHEPMNLHTLHYSHKKRNNWNS